MRRSAPPTTGPATAQHALRNACVALLCAGRQGPANTASACCGATLGYLLVHPPLVPQVVPALLLLLAVVVVFGDPPQACLPLRIGLVTTGECRGLIWISMLCATP